MGQARSKVRTLNLDKELAGWLHPVRRKQWLSDLLGLDEQCPWNGEILPHHSAAAQSSVDLETQ